MPVRPGSVQKFASSAGVNLQVLAILRGFCVACHYVEKLLCISRDQIMHDLSDPGRLCSAHCGRFIGFRERLRYRDSHLSNFRVTGCNRAGADDQTNV